MGARLAFAAIVACASLARASDLLGPIQHLQGKHIGDGEPLTWSIEYFDQWGRTVIDATGGHFFHDRCCGGYETDDPTWIYPAKYYGTYPMYYIGTTLSYRITLTNNGPRSYRNLRVVAIQEYFNAAGGAGDRMGAGAARDWYLAELKPNQTVTLDGLYAIGGDAHAGLDQTHLQIQHWNRGRGRPGPGSVIVDDTKAAIWCPPEMETDGARDAVGAATGVTGVLEVSGGRRGFLEGAETAVIAVRTAGGGEVAVRLFDQRGRLVRSWTAPSGGEQRFTWDGTDETGGRAAPGVYLVIATAPGFEGRDKIVVVR